MKFQSEPYRTPEGKIDFPFCYVFDASAITDGLAQLQNNSVQLQGGSEFVLRSIRGVNLCVDTPQNGGKFTFRNPSGAYANGNPSTGIIVGNNWPVLPEKVYPSENGAIFFDLYQTLRNFTVCGQGNIWNSFIAFCGVKRLPNVSGYPNGVTAYRYRPKKYTYELDLTINWNHFDAGGNIAPPRRFTVDMDRYDFELMRVSISLTTAGSQATGALTTNDFQVMAYDANMHQLSNLPLNQFFINSGRPTPATAPTYQPALAPTIVYPFGSTITIDVTSMLCNAVASPQTYNIAFEGVWRLPC